MRGLSRRGRVWLKIGVLALAACGGGDRNSPSDVVVQFYTMRDAIGVQGAPSGDELAALRPFIADTLALGLATANAQRLSTQPSAMDSMSRLVRGDLFSSLFEGPTTFRVLAAIPSDALTLVPVEFTSDRVRPAVRWTDTVTVVSQAGRYLVQDVRYGVVRGTDRAPSLLARLAAQP